MLNYTSGVVLLLSLQMALLVMLFIVPDYMFFLVNLPLFVITYPMVFVNLGLGWRIIKKLRLPIFIWSTILIVLPFIDTGVLINKIYNSRRIDATRSYNNGELTICSQNTAGVSFRYKGFWDLVYRQDCDIVLLQEVWSHMPDDIIMLPLSGFVFDKVNLNGTYPYYQRFQEFVFLSRFPIKIEYKSRYEGFASASISLGKERIYIVNVHIWTPLHQRNIHTFLIPEVFEGEGSFIPPQVLRRLQIKELLAYIARLGKQQVVMIGDFNTLPHNVLIRQIIEFGYYKVGGFIAYPTFSSQFPIIMIDHVFINLLGYATTARVFHKYSDHALLKVIID